MTSADNLCICLAPNTSSQPGFWSRVFSYTSSIVHMLQLDMRHMDKYWESENIWKQYWNCIDFPCKIYYITIYIHISLLRQGGNEWQFMWLVSTQWTFSDLILKPGLYFSHRLPAAVTYNFVAKADDYGCHYQLSSKCAWALFKYKQSPDRMAIWSIHRIQIQISLLIHMYTEK